MRELRLPPYNARLRTAEPDLLEALKATVEIVAEELTTIIDCATMPCGDLSTLDDLARPAVERYQTVLTLARAAITKATGIPA